MEEKTVHVQYRHIFLIFLIHGGWIYGCGIHGYGGFTIFKVLKW
jgi:hypothetical protein